MTKQTYGTTWDALLTAHARPLVLTGMLRDILSRHFQEDNIEDPRLRELIWRESEDSPILIESAHRWRPQQSGQRPAVIVRRNDYANSRLSIGDTHQGPELDGAQHFTSHWAGSHTLFCLGGSGAQAECLGSEVQRQMTEFSAIIRQTARLHRFGVIQIGAVGELEEAQENFVVPVTVGYVFEENWTVSVQSPRLSKISLKTVLEY